METLTMGAVVKVITDLVMKAVGMFKWKASGIVVHGVVLVVAVGVMVGYDALYGVPFNVLELLKAAFSAIGLNEFIGAASGPAAPSAPQVNQ